MQAWVVDAEHGEDAQEVIFEDDDTTQEQIEKRWECEAVRKPEWDQYASLGSVPPEVLLDAGWWITCTHCEHPVSSGGCTCDQDLNGNPCEGFEDWSAIVVVGDNVYCCEKCRLDHDEDHRRYHEAHQRLGREAREALAKRWPEATFEQADWLDSDYKTFRVQFRVPWCKHAVHWEPARSTAFVTREDLESWQRHGDMQASEQTIHA